MADPVVTLDPTRVSVDPGGQARITVTVANTGAIVEGYRIEVLGEAAAWTEVTPADVSVYPQQTATAVVVFSPPAGSTVSGGVLAFGVRARSTVDPDASAVAEGDLEVNQVVGLQAKITPVTSTGRWRGYHLVQFSNWGNSAVRLKVTAADPDEALGFLVKPPVIDVPLGGMARAKITVRTRKPFLRGNPVRLPFQVVGEREDAGPQTGPTQPYADPGRPVVDAALNQKPILTKTVVIIGALVLAAIVAAVAYAVTRPNPDQQLPNSVPPTPELAAVPIGPDTIQLTWKKIDLVQGYTLFTIDPQTKGTFGTQKLDADLNQFPIAGLKPKSVHCYQLQSVRPNLLSRRSNLACATTLDAAASASPTPTTSPAQSPSSSATATTSSSASTGGSSTTTTPSQSPTSGGSAAVPAGKWIAAARFSMSQNDIDQVIMKLGQNGQTATWLDGTLFPQMVTDSGTPFHWSGPIAYVGPFDSPDQAKQACTKIDPMLDGVPPVGQSCQVLQPGQQQ
jgi:hypothetical protein